jgi:hypothetical protein
MGLSKEKEKAIEKALDDIAIGVETILTSDDWKRWLAFMSKFHAYSPLNTIWMWSQWETRRRVDAVFRAMASAFGSAWEPMPEFSLPAAFSAWKKMGRYVKKGEKALSVLAPVFIKTIDEDTGEKHQVLIGFKVVNRTFEVSQTDGADLPENPIECHPLQGECDEKIWTSLVKVAELANFPAEVEELPPGLHGFCRYTENDPEKPAKGVIKINAANSPYQRTKTLIHEVAHALLHNPQEYERAHIDSRNIAEVEAESVAFVVAETLGMATEAFSFGYVAHWSNGNSRSVAESATRILDTARRILIAMETGSLPKTGREVRDLKAMEPAAA